jgi:hypothetical protein
MGRKPTTFEALTRLLDASDESLRATFDFILSDHTLIREQRCSILGDTIGAWRRAVVDACAAAAATGAISRSELYQLCRHADRLADEVVVNYPRVAEIIDARK